MTPVAEERTSSTPLLILLAAGALAVISVALVLVMRSASQPPSAISVLSREQQAYLRQIVVTEARMSAAENFLGGTVTYLDAWVTNKGPKVVRRLEVELKFVDTLGQVVLRDIARPITVRTPPLKPGEMRPFRISFDRMPADWNQAPPAITPRYVEW